MISRDEFDAQAEQVVDAYPDFTRSLYSCAKNSQCVSLVYDFMKSNKDATSDQILALVDDYLGNPIPLKVRSSQKEESSRSAVAV